MLTGEARTVGETTQGERRGTAETLALTAPILVATAVSFATWRIGAWGTWATLALWFGTAATAVPLVARVRWRGVRGRLGDGVHRGAVVGGKYVLERLIGSGATGVVLSATDRQLGIRVAIKVLSAKAQASPEAIQRLRREARNAARLHSPHCVRVLDLGTLDGGAPFLVMDLLEGEDLRKWLKNRGPLPAALATDIVLQACDAVAEAHELGMVHRDLKPANLFCVRGAGDVPLIKVLDFGTSKLLDAEPDDDITRARVAVGSPLYMSPEQIRASRPADARVDVWALGAILYEMLACQSPFDAPTVREVCARILNERAEPLRHVRPDLSPELVRVVERCLAPKPRDRFANAREVADALRRARMDGARRAEVQGAVGNVASSARG